jgi:hypothetical protein
MSDLGLSSLANVQQIGQYGNHLNALAWLTITATLMYVGVPTYSFIYLLIYDHPRAKDETKLTPLDISEEAAEERKAA